MITFILGFLDCVIFGWFDFGLTYLLCWLYWLLKSCILGLLFILVVFIAILWLLRLLCVGYVYLGCGVLPVSGFLLFVVLLLLTCCLLLR